MLKKMIYIYFFLIVGTLLSGCGIKDSLNEVPINSNEIVGEPQSEGMSASQAVTDHTQTEQKVTEHKDTEQTETKQTEAIELRAMQIAEFSDGGKIFVDIPEKDIKKFQDKVATVTIPDARKGERAANIQDEDWYKGLVFLNSIPEKNIYLYGYNDEELFGFGLILDIGTEQHTYTFPIPYMSSHAIAPAISTSEDGSKIFVSCLTGTGTGTSVSQLYVFQVNDEAEVFYVDINRLVELLNNKISMTYDSTNNIMTVYSEGKQIATDSLIGTGGIPEGFYCGKFIHYEFGNDSVKVICKPVINLRERAPTDSYLEKVSLEADIIFEYDGNGKIIGFNIGEITAVY